MSRMLLTSVVVGGIGTLLFVAGVDALRSSESETVRPTAVGSTTTKNEASPPATASTAENEASLSAWQEIERAGNEWARLFAAGDRHWPAPGTCQYMTQPGCERISCERVGARPIEDCTRPSWAFRKSFADATVTAIAIKGRQAAARFSNGETVEFTEIGVSGSYWIHKVGGNAGRKLFANEPG
jgi:hypothetical protein